MNAGIQKATPAQVAEAIELRQIGKSWELIALTMGCVSRQTWRDYVRKAELLGFKAWQ